MNNRITNDLPSTADTQRRQAIKAFTERNAAYYERAFARLGSSGRLRLTWNWAAAIFGPIWLGARRLWGSFWPFLLAELLGWILFAQGLAGGAGSEAAARAKRLGELAANRLEEARHAVTNGDPLAQSLQQSAASLAKAAEQAQSSLAQASGKGPILLALGIGLIIAIRSVLGLLGSSLLERRFRRWRRIPAAPAGLSLPGAAAAVVLILLIVPVTLYAFTAARIPSGLVSVPTIPSWHEGTAAWLDASIAGLSAAIAPLALGITRSINATLDLLETCLVRTPWPVVMVVILALAYQLAGIRVFVLTLVALAYLGLLGYWAKAMETVALLGTAAFVSVLVGLPLGVWCGYNARVARIVRPILDFMQTMPAFVYLIPVIALFGIGKPSGIIATVIFGTPPVVRLTTLGIQGVPKTVREAALAFGATRAFLTWKVDLPLALPSIMIGINQTILMCLSMVVIASLIGAKGLGEDVLTSLQYAAQGEGILAGVAILACAIVLDRIVQGRASDGPR
ncbi:ABC transporter permease [Labrys sp. La1]|uniref:ABC transporter permease n=1 Tax=Labrys sp. La1 TaxID=3404917 RepID=UPI003EB86E4E